MSVKLDLMKSGVITLPGGIDNTGHLVLVFPTSALSLIHIRYSGAHLMTLVQQYLDTVPDSLRGPGYAFAIDMTILNRESVQVVVDTIEKIQRSRPGVVSCLYAVLPQNKEALKLFRKLVGIKVSKKIPQTASFQTVAVSSVSELNTHIDPRQRTADFGGSLRYNHDMYMKFIQRFEEVEAKVEQVEYRFPVYSDKVAMLQEYELPAKMDARERLLAQIHNKYHEVMRELNIDAVIDECRIMLEKMKAPENDPDYSEIMHTPLFGVAKGKVEGQLKDLVKSRKQLQGLLQTADARVAMPSKVDKYTAKAHKVLAWLEDIGQPTVMQDPEIAECLSKAELYKHHFEAGFFTIAQNVLWLSDKITKKIQSSILLQHQQRELRGQGGGEGTGQGGGEGVDAELNEDPDSTTIPATTATLTQEMEELLKFSQHFQSKVSSFRAGVEKKRLLYENIHQFFLTSDKLSVWYKRTLKFLPLHLLRSRSTADTQQVASHTLHPTDAWVSAVENYLMYNPCPNTQLTHKLQTILPAIDNLSVRNQARILVHRVCVLCRVLSRPRLLPRLHQEVSDVTRWKDSLTSDTDDVLYDMSRSAPDLTRLQLTSRPELTGLNKPVSSNLLVPGSSSSSILRNSQSMNSVVNRLGSMEVLLDGSPTVSSNNGSRDISSGRKSPRPKKPKRKNLALKGYSSTDGLDHISTGSSPLKADHSFGGSGLVVEDLSRVSSQGDREGVKLADKLREEQSEKSFFQNQKHYKSLPGRYLSEPGGMNMLNVSAPNTVPPPLTQISHSDDRRSNRPSTITTKLKSKHYGSTPNIAQNGLRVKFVEHFGAESDTPLTVHKRPLYVHTSDTDVHNTPVNVHRTAADVHHHGNIGKYGRSISQPHIPKLDLSFLQNTGYEENATEQDSVNYLLKEKSYNVYGESRRKVPSSSVSSGSNIFNMESTTSDSMNGAGNQGRYRGLSLLSRSPRADLLLRQVSPSPHNVKSHREVLFASEPTIITDAVYSRSKSVSPHVLFSVAEKVDTYRSGMTSHGNTPRTQENTPRTQGNTPRTPRTPRSSREYPMSLSLVKTGMFELNEENVEAVVNSNLSEEDKLNIMAAMCEAEDTVQDQVLSGNSDDLQQTDSSITSKSINQPDEDSTGFQNGFGIEGNLGNIGNGDYSVDPEYRDSLFNSYITSGISGAARCNSIPYKQDSYTQKPHHEHSGARPKSGVIHRAGAVKNRKDELILKKRVKKTSNSKGVEESDFYGDYNGKSGHVTRSRRDELMKSYGIDIQAWIDKQKSGSVETETSYTSSLIEGTSSSCGTDVLEDCRTKLEIVRANRLNDEAELEKEMLRLRDLELEQQEEEQEEVEHTLRRAENILKEDTDAVVDNNKIIPPPQVSDHNTEERTRRDLIISNTSTPATTTTPVTTPSAAVSPVQRTNSTGNTSVESGVFTQTSQDSPQARKSENSCPPALLLPPLSNHKHDESSDMGSPDGRNKRSDNSSITQFSSSSSSRFVGDNSRNNDVLSDSAESSSRFIDHTFSSSDPHSSSSLLSREDNNNTVLSTPSTPSTKGDRVFMTVDMSSQLPLVLNCSSDNFPESLIISPISQSMLSNSGNQPATAKSADVLKKDHSNTVVIKSGKSVLDKDRSETAVINSSKRTPSKNHILSENLSNSSPVNHSSNSSSNCSSDSIRSQHIILPDKAENEHRPASGSPQISNLKQSPVCNLSTAEDEKISADEVLNESVDSNGSTYSSSGSDYASTSSSYNHEDTVEIDTSVCDTIKVSELPLSLLIDECSGNRSSLCEEDSGDKILVSKSVLEHPHNSSANDNDSFLTPSMSVSSINGLSVSVNEHSVSSNGVKKVVVKPGLSKTQNEEILALAKRINPQSDSNSLLSANNPNTGTTFLPEDHNNKTSSSISVNNKNSAFSTVSKNKSSSKYVKLAVHNNVSSRDNRVKCPVESSQGQSLGLDDSRSSIDNEIKQFLALRENESPRSESLNISTPSIQQSLVGIPERRSHLAFNVEQISDTSLQSSSGVPSSPEIIPKRRSSFSEGKSQSPIIIPERRLSICAGDKKKIVIKPQVYSTKQLDFKELLQKAKADVHAKRASPLSYKGKRVSGNNPVPITSDISSTHNPTVPVIISKRKHGVPENKNKHLAFSKDSKVEHLKPFNLELIRKPVQIQSKPVKIQSKPVQIQSSRSAFAVVQSKTDRPSLNSSTENLNNAKEVKNTLDSREDVKYSTAESQDKSDGDYSRSKDASKFKIQSNTSADKKSDSDNLLERYRKLMEGDTDIKKAPENVAVNNNLGDFFNICDDNIAVNLSDGKRSGESQETPEALNVNLTSHTVNVSHSKLDLYVDNSLVNNSLNGGSHSLTNHSKVCDGHKSREELQAFCLDSKFHSSTPRNYNVNKQNNNEERENTISTKPEKNTAFISDFQDDGDLNDTVLSSIRGGPTDNDEFYVDENETTPVCSFINEDDTDFLDGNDDRKDDSLKAAEHSCSSAGFSENESTPELEVYMYNNSMIQDDVIEEEDEREAEDQREAADESEAEDQREAEDESEAEDQREAEEENMAANITVDAENVMIKGLSTQEFNDVINGKLVDDDDNDLNDTNCKSESFSRTEKYVIDDNPHAHDLSQISQGEVVDMGGSECLTTNLDDTMSDLDDSIYNHYEDPNNTAANVFKTTSGSANKYIVANAENAGVILPSSSNKGGCAAGNDLCVTRECNSLLSSGPCLNSQVLSLGRPVIIDNGSGVCKAGLAGEERPSAVFPALVGRPKYSEVMTHAYRAAYVGDAAQSMRGVLALSYPLEHGIVNNWTDMQMIWNEAFSNQLRVDPTEHPVLMTEAPLNPKKNRERMMEILFETFQVPAMYVCVQAVLGLYATGRSTGIVLDIGDGVSHVVPVYEGHSLPHATHRVNLAGRHLTQYLTKLLYENGHKFNTTAECEIARDIKENLCYVAADYDAEVTRYETSAGAEGHYTMPDGRGVTLGSQRFRCPEALFQPDFLGREHPGIHHSVYDSVQKCEVDIRRDLLSNVVLSGGSTMFTGLPERLSCELRRLCLPGLADSVAVTGLSERRYLVWQGGSVLAGMDSFQGSWILSDEYREMGAHVVHQKCF